jgi:hypothetical protein
LAALTAIEMKGALQKRTRRVAGQVVEIDLGNGFNAYGRVLEEPLFAFYEEYRPNDLHTELAEILGWRVAFRIWVMNYAITKGRWRVIGSRPLSSEELHKPEFFKQDPINGQLSIYDDNKAPSYERPAIFAECEHLECAAVWDPTHVEDRLRDHIAGKPNRWTNSLRIKPAFDWK